MDLSPWRNGEEYSTSIWTLRERSQSQEARMGFPILASWLLASGFLASGFFPSAQFGSRSVQGESFRANLILDLFARIGYDTDRCARLQHLFHEAAEVHTHGWSQDDIQ